MNSLCYSYNIYNMFFLVSRYPDFLIASCIHAFENYVQSIVLHGLRVLPRNKPKIVGFLGEHKYISRCSVDGVQYVFVRTSIVHFFVKIFQIFYIFVLVGFWLCQEFKVFHGSLTHPPPLHH